MHLVITLQKNGTRTLLKRSVFGGMVLDIVKIDLCWCLRKIVKIRDLMKQEYHGTDWTS